MKCRFKGAPVGFKNFGEPYGSAYILWYKTNNKQEFVVVKKLDGEN